MKRPAPRIPELLEALEALSAQGSYLADLGEERYCSERVEGQVARLATGQLIIQLQALLEDLPEHVRQALPPMTLREIRGMRNRLAHGYGDIDAAMLWATVHRALPAFLSTVRRELEASAGSTGERSRWGVRSGEPQRTPQ